LTEKKTWKRCKLQASVLFQVMSKGRTEEIKEEERTK